MEKAEPTGSLVTATRLAFTAALGGFLFGYDSAVINGAVTITSAPAAWASRCPPHCSAQPSVRSSLVAWRIGLDV
jgi:hypothetical protein